MSPGNLLEIIPADLLDTLYHDNTKSTQSAQLVPITWTTVVSCPHRNQCKTFTFKTTFVATTHQKVYSCAPVSTVFYSAP